MYFAQLKEKAPFIRYYVEAYHMRTTGSGKRRRTHKVVTYRDTKTFYFKRCVDSTLDYSFLFEELGIFRVKTVLKWEPGDEVTNQRWT